MEPLPVDAVRDDLERALQQARRFILAAPTGSGKSTRVPPMLAASGQVGGGQIVVLQPRRMAARLLASRVAAERGEKPGATVGYRTRFEGKESEATRILFVTEGILLRRLLSSPALEGISAVLFDEFHERHLYGDLMLALLTRLQEGARPDLVLGVMSATLEIEGLRRYLGEATPVIESAGRQFPVDVRHVKVSQGYAENEPCWDAAVRAARELLREDSTGNLLVFMPGAYEIRRTIERLNEIPEVRGRRVVPLHGDLSPADQDAAVAADGPPRVIVSTNIAETSLTIPGVTRVIDSGLARIPSYDPGRGVNTLHVEKISRASADQRAGRAGRTAPGVCVRLWTERDHERRPSQLEPEIARLELSEILLALRSAGLHESVDFEWFEAPPAELLQHAHDLLRMLGALDAADHITQRGQALAKFPLHPRQATMLLRARELDIPNLGALACALMQDRSLVLPKSDNVEVEGALDSDLLVEVEALRRMDAVRFEMGACRRMGFHRGLGLRAMELAQRFGGMLGERWSLERVSAELGNVEGLNRSVLAGFPDQVAKRVSERTRVCRLAGGRNGEIGHFSRIGSAPLFVCSRLEERVVGGRASILLMENSAIEEKWLETDFPGLFRDETAELYDEDRRRVVRLHRRLFGELELESVERGEPDADAAAAVLAGKVLDGELVLKNWNMQVDSWIARMNAVARAFPEYEFGVIDDEGRRLLVEQICHGATSYKEIKDRAVLPVVQEWISGANRPMIDQLAPERIELRNGQRVRLRYEADGSVVVSGRIQQFYDVPQDSIRVLDGRVAPKFEFLAPNQRPVQISDDLDGFWANSYPQIKKDLKGRYPKHEWR